MKALRILIVPVVLAAFAFIAVFALKAGPKDTVATWPPADNFIVSGSLLGNSECVIYYTIDEKMHDEVTNIDCPPEGLPAEAAAKSTLREQAIVLFPKYEETIQSLRK